MRSNFTGKLIIICHILFIAQLSFGQSRIIRNRGFYYTLEGTVGYGLEMKTDYYNELSPTPFSLGVKASANIFLSYHLSVGTGLGINQYSAPVMTTLPLTINLKYFTGKAAESPFVYAEGGYSFRTDADQQHKGPVYEVGIGYRHQLQRRHNFFLFKLGYSYFRTEHWLYTNKPNTLNSDFDMQWYYLERPAINFSVCFYHSTRY